MKYEGYFALAQPLAELMVEAWPTWQHTFDLVVPVPLHPVRRRKRGYNQAELLVQGLQKRLNWKSEPQALVRSRRTRPQVGLSPQERSANVHGAFAADEGKVAGKRILLVDDVCTTGSTLAAAADVLLEAKASSVTAYCLTLAAENPDLTHA